MQLFNKIQESLVKNSNRNAFFIKDTFYTYLEFAETISKLRECILLNSSESEKNIGLVTNDDIETYAAIIALWFEGKAYVPISPETPKSRNEAILKQVDIRTIIDSSTNPLFPELNVIESRKLPDTTMGLNTKVVSDQELVYILFTSGTTGKPKGVPISRANLTGFINAFESLGVDIGQQDKCLQMFELTFDLSVMAYLVPLLNGSCVYTVRKDKIKYSYIFELLDEHELTFALMVPSVLHFLRPYFAEIHCPKMRYNLFCGEALPEDLTNEWSQCLPNATILNVYGPTEDTIFCTSYTFKPNMSNKSHHGILAIGKAMKGTEIIIVDDKNNPLPDGEAGELCLGGIQLTPGYWNNEKENKEVFFYSDYNKQSTRFYKTGDICTSDKDGDIIYKGRLDNQIKIQGFRVELSEIEFFSNAFFNNINAVAVALTNSAGNTEIGLIIESGEFDTTELIRYLKIKIPAYMIPTKICFEKVFPLNANGKIDRSLLKQKLLDRV